MAGYKGRLAALVKMEDNGSPGTFVAVGGVTSSGFTLQTDAITVSDLIGLSEQTAIDAQGNQSFVCNVSGFYTDSAMLDQVESAAIARDSKNFRVTFENGDEYRAACVVTGFSRSGGYSGAESCEFTIESDGAITFVDGTVPVLDWSCATYTNLWQSGDETMQAGGFGLSADNQTAAFGQFGKMMWSNDDHVTRTNVQFTSSEFQPHDALVAWGKWHFTGQNQLNTLPYDATGYETGDTLTAVGSTATRGSMYYDDDTTTLYYCNDLGTGTRRIGRSTDGVTYDDAYATFVNSNFTHTEVGVWLMDSKLHVMMYYSSTDEHRLFYETSEGSKTFSSVSSFPVNWIQKVGSAYYGFKENKFYKNTGNPYSVGDWVLEQTFSEIAVANGKRHPLWLYAGGAWVVMESAGNNKQILYTEEAEPTTLIELDTIAGIDNPQALKWSPEHRMFLVAGNFIFAAIKDC